MDYQREEIWLACAHKYFIFLPEMLGQIKRNPHNAIEEWADQRFPRTRVKESLQIRFLPKVGNLDQPADPLSGEVGFGSRFFFDELVQMEKD